MPAVLGIIGDRRGTSAVAKMTRWHGDTVPAVRDERETAVTGDDSATRANIARFDEIAESWDENRDRTDLARAIGHAILAVTHPHGTARALEFGCGTGLVTALLAPAVGHVVAVDNSPGMLDVLQRKAQALGLDNVEPRRIDVGREVPGGPFDLIFSGMTLHHIEDVAGLLRRLAGELAPGGWIAVADLELENGTFHGNAAGIMHHGFDPREVVRWLESAGLEAIATRRIHIVGKTGADGHEHEYPVFLATAKRGSAATS